MNYFIFIFLFTHLQDGLCVPSTIFVHDQENDWWWPGLVLERSAVSAIIVQLFPLDEGRTCEIVAASKLNAATGLMLSGVVSDLQEEFQRWLDESSANLPWDSFRLYITALLDYIQFEGWNVPELVQTLHTVRQTWLTKYPKEIEEEREFWKGILEIDL